MSDPRAPVREARPFKRVLLKLSGEALQGTREGGFDADVVGSIADEIVEATKTGVQVALVVGGGNFWRGRAASTLGMDRASADHVGMLATVMNALVMQSALEQRGQHTRVASAIGMDELAEPYIRRRAMRHLEKGRTVVFAAGTGMPFFTTDTGAALRAVEIGADAMLKGTLVDGIYTSDPKLDPDAERLAWVAHRDVITRKLSVMDVTAVSLAEENSLPIVVFKLDEPGNVTRALKGDAIGSLISTPDEGV